MSQTMSKSKKIPLFIIVLIIASIYIVSPPLSLTIEIIAKPQGIQEFYVVTKSSVPGFHGRDVKTIDKRMVLANKKTKIPLSLQTHWFGLITTTIYHPEYFWELEETSNRFFMPKVQLNPTAWIDAFSKSPRWVTQAPSMNQPSEKYHAEMKIWGAGIDSHQIIHMSHVHFHINSMNTEFLKVFMRTKETDKLQKSIGVLDIIVKEFDDGMLEESIATFGPSEYVQKQIDETHAALGEIHKKFGQDQDSQ